MKDKIPFQNVLVYTLYSTFKSFRNYLFSIILPIFIVLAIYLIKTSFGQDDFSEKSGQIYNLLIIPFTFSLFAFSSTLVNWKESILIKQSKFFSISKTNFYFSIFISISLLTLISLIFSIFSLFIIDYFLEIKNFTVTFWNMAGFYIIKGNFYEYLTFLSAIILLILFFTLYLFLIFNISYITSLKIKSIVLIQAINFVLIILFFGLADVALDINLVTNKRAQMIYNIFGYLIPAKSFQWLFISLFTNTTFANYNILETIVSPNLEVPYTFLTNKIWMILPTTLFFSTVWTIAFFMLIQIFNKKGIW
ncbi:hypothetical protein EMELA_v1c06580 [Mesoplasma melaleucae]|uniref:Uncharacterized protein n=1 Tax=Mesoplasma melaleucae TaxID=81459 RepID=A0A2K8NWE1_9MOLU|nr:hypothetical protein [Mesoplasma melaleucae]ATZ18165.1 hypothetical protein EMELA_v1c06580 [Mesoplasma melaleucae]